MTIHTYYESRPTSTVTEGPDGHWERRGEALVMVERSSALLNVEPEKTRVKVDGDHRQIVRLWRGQGSIYPNVLRIIKEALVNALDQFAAAQAAQATVIEGEGASAVKPDPAVRVGKNTTKDRWWDYDGYNLICEVCYKEIPKNQMHMYCYSCGDGNYKVCLHCNDDGKTCIGGHDMLLQRPSDDKDDDQEEGEAGFKWTSRCNVCSRNFLFNGVRLYCGLCNFNVCLGCRKSGNICVRGHRLLDLPY